MSDKSEILVVIPDEDLPELARMYKDCDEAPYVYTTILTGIHWKKLGKPTYTFTSPNNCWREDGTVFIFIEFNLIDLHIYTLSNNYDNIYKGLKSTNRIKSGTKINFYSIHNSIAPTVRKFIKETNKTVPSDVTCSTYVLSIDKALKLDTSCPPETYVDRLKVDNTSQINDTWPFNYPNSDRYVLETIQNNDCFGLYLKESGELVAWALTHHMGILGLLYTEENHRKKGYGSIITKFLSKEMAGNGVRPIGNVVVGNRASEIMFERMGFKNIGTCDYIKVIF
ncbi:uncharacterized protein LOC109603674 isoform X2 [Aethina tumida]|uniref:uncharacterized protein LOC109603674 isoform X2 n=1 Tax=Aethina tumida TaxID=116153 RepID=UPI002147D6A7|nr:uncharacterized protein LOC109603674 isoform X2 [Aethina tumida]